MANPTLTTVDFALAETRILASWQDPGARVHVASFTTDFRNQFYDWCGWMRHYGFDIYTEFKDGVQRAYMRPGAAALLLEMQHLDPTRFGEPWKHRKLL